MYHLPSPLWWKKIECGKKTTRKIVDIGREEILSGEKSKTFYTKKLKEWNQVGKNIREKTQYSIFIGGGKLKMGKTSKIF